MVILYIYVDGQGFIAENCSTNDNPMKISDEAAEGLGKQIWEDLKQRQLVLYRLLSKLTLTIHEEMQFELIQDKIADRELDLCVTLTDAEYQCAHYTFMHSLPHRRELTKPNYCERQIRRHTKKALIKTGLTAFSEGWKPIQLLSKDSKVAGRSEVQKVSTR